MLPKFGHGCGLDKNGRGGADFSQRCVTNFRHEGDAAAKVLSGGSGEIFQELKTRFDRRQRGDLSSAVIATIPASNAFAMEIVSGRSRML